MNKLTRIKNSTKAALVSAFVLPGAGLFLVGRHLLGVLLVLPPLLALIYLMRHYIEKTKAVLERILLGEIPADPWLMFTLIKHEANSDTAWRLGLALWVYLITWALGIFVSALAGHREDKRLAAINLTYRQSLQAETLPTEGNR